MKESDQCYHDCKFTRCTDGCQHYKKAYEELINKYAHFHVAGKDDIDSCDKCGLDLFHEIHFRTDKESGKPYINYVC